MRTPRFPKSSFEERDGIWKDIHVIREACQTLPVLGDHVCGADGVEIVDEDLLHPSAFKAEDVGLADFSIAGIGTDCADNESERATGECYKGALRGWKTHMCCSYQKRNKGLRRRRELRGN